MEKEAATYSEIWTNRKTTPSERVRAKGRNMFLKWRTFLWAHVTLTPDLRRITVFNSGTPNPSITEIPTWGQVPPTSKVGIKEKVKNPQKKEAKNATSERINKMKAKRIALFKPLVIDPMFASFTKSINQEQKIQTKPPKLSKNKTEVPSPSMAIIEKTDKSSHTHTKIGRYLSFSVRRKLFQVTRMIISYSSGVWARQPL